LRQLLGGDRGRAGGGVRLQGVGGLLEPVGQLLAADPEAQVGIGLADVAAQPAAVTVEEALGTVTGDDTDGAVLGEVVRRPRQRVLDRAHGAPPRADRELFEN
jgi:hypothetical protein